MIEVEDKLNKFDQKKKELDEVLSRLRKEHDELLYYVSHEFKSPLRAIMHLTQWLEEDIGEEISKEAKKNLELLRNRVNKLESMTEALLQYARAGMIGFEVTCVNVKELVNEIIDLLNAPPEFKFSVDNNLPEFDTYYNKLWQVLWNVMENSIKHHDKHKGEIKINFKEKPDHYEFVIKDNGPGIPREKLDKIFTLFQSGSSDYNLGTGLPVTKKILDHTGGNIEIISTSEKGTEVKIEWKKINNDKN